MRQDLQSLDVGESRVAVVEVHWVLAEEEEMERDSAGLAEHYI